MSDSGDEPTQFDMPPVTPPAGVPPVPPVPPPPGPGGPLPPDEEEPPDRRPWIIAALIAAIALVVLLILLLGGDDDDDVATDSTTTSSSSTTSSSTTTSTSTTVASTTTTAAPTTTEAPTTTQAPPVTINPATCAAAGADGDDPETAAQTVHDAWLRGDEACAAELMTAPALTNLFDRDPQERDAQGCTAVDDHIDCSFFTPGSGGSALHFLMRFDDSGPWQVFEVNETEG